MIGAPPNRPRSWNEFITRGATRAAPNDSGIAPRFQRAAGLTDEELAISTSGSRLASGSSRPDTHEYNSGSKCRARTEACRSRRRMNPRRLRQPSPHQPPKVKKPKVKQPEPKEEKEEVHELICRMNGRLCSRSAWRRGHRSNTGRATAKPSGTQAPPAEPGAIEEFQIGEELPSFARRSPAAAAKAIPFAEISAELPATDEAKKTPAPECQKSPQGARAGI